MVLPRLSHILRISVWLGQFWRRYRKNKGAVLGLFFLFFLALVALLADFISTYEPMEPGVGLRLEPPSQHFLMGTDNLARDIFSGVVHGSRVSLLIGFSASFTAILLGGLVGAISGYFGGRIDDMLMRFCEVFQSMPRFLFALVIVVFFGSTIWNVVVVIGLLSWPRTARMLRAEFLRLRESEFVTASRAIGMRSGRIILRHILPNTAHILLVTGSLEVGAAIITEAGLSFLGVGDPNLMSWGRMLFNAQPVFR
ncbi:unnamed protein product, partial [marine sediment metagenome]